MFNPASFIILPFNNIKEILSNVKLLKNNCLKKITILINELKLCRNIIIRFIITLRYNFNLLIRII